MRFDSKDRLAAQQLRIKIRRLRGSTFIAHLGRLIRPCNFLEPVLNLPQRVVVQHEKLPRLRPGVPQQLDALGRATAHPGGTARLTPA
jgi:hypothetical protein